jgi:hypothetical protein
VELAAVVDVTIVVKDGDVSFVDVEVVVEVDMEGDVVKVATLVEEAVEVALVDVDVEVVATGAGLNLLY